MILIANVAVAQQVVVTPSVSHPEQTAFTVDLDLHTAGLAVQGFEVILTYDPALVRLDGIDAGTWLADSGFPYFFHDFTAQAPAGQLHFDGALLGGSSVASGQAARCRFTALGPGESPLSFVEVDVRGPDNQDLGFGHSTGDLIVVDVGQVHFAPAVTTPVTAEFTVDLAIGAVGYRVESAEVVVTFDPAIVSLLDVTPGAWITGQGLTYQFDDFTTPGTGEIHFALTYLDGAGTGSGVLAVCRFAALHVGTSPLDFVTVEMRDPDGLPLAFTHSAGDRIVIDPAVGSRATSLGALKASFR
jgi:hypothetical protein